MADNVTLIVNETIDNVVINPSITTETVDINVSGTDTYVDISVTPNLTIVNINKTTGVNVQDLQSVLETGNTSDVQILLYTETSADMLDSYSADGSGVYGHSDNGIGVKAFSANGISLDVELGNSTQTGINISSTDTSTGIPFQVVKNSVTKASINQEGELTASKLIKSGGTSSQFLMADGSTSNATAGTTNLTTSQTSTNFTINSDTGTDASVPLGNGTLAGATINDYTTTEKSKLSGIASGAEVNVNADWNAVSGDAQILNKPTIPSIAGLATVTYVDTQDALKVDKVTGSRLITSSESTILGNTSGTNTGDNATNSQYNGLAASKQDNITLTTTGSSGAATLVGATLNIPQYSGGSTITNTSQLINDGDDGISHFISLEDLPSSLTLYATNAASDVSTYYKLVSSITDSSYNTTAVDIPTGTITTTNQFIAALITSPNIIVGNPGIFNITTIGNIQKLTGTGNAEFYFEVYKRVAAGTETLITTSAATLPVLNSGYAEFSASALWNDGTFLSTDRIVLKYYGSRIPTGSNPTYQFQFGGISPVRSLVPIPLSVVPVLKLDELLDVTTTTPTNNDLLTYETSTSLWKNKSASTLGLAPLASPTFTGTVVLPSTTSIGNVSSTELGYLDNVTSAIQTQFSGKQPLATNLTTIANYAGAPYGFIKWNSGTGIGIDTISYATSASPTFTGTVVLPSTTSIGTISATEIGYLDNVTSSIQDQFTAKQDKSLAANSIMANNTTSAANAVAQVYKDIAEATLVGVSTITWVGTAPTNPINLTYRWTQIGSLVNVRCNLVYTTAGSGNTQVTISLPTDMPTPATISGFTSALDVQCYGQGSFSSTKALVGTNSTGPTLRRNAANNGYEFVIPRATNAATTVWFSIQYFV